MVEQARCIRASLEHGSKTFLKEAAKSLALSLKREVSLEEAADVIAQAGACAAPIIAAAADDADRSISWLFEQLAPWERESLRRARGLSTRFLVRGGRINEDASSAHQFENFFRQYAASSRRHR